MLTSGQQRALVELQRLCAAQPNDIEIITEPAVQDGRLVVVISIRMGAIESRNGGLEFREREEFKLFVPADFPFHRPWLSVMHDRFAGFPHVIWSHGICLYRQAADWNPRGGMYGFFEKLRLWLAKAAINDEASQGCRA
jgi:DNA-binding transcriptional LysR family regulator